MSPFQQQMSTLLIKRFLAASWFKATRTLTASNQSHASMPPTNV
uniref:Uncharacterized protein n=1 Tax=Anguilla anguilla TaxID=7936 RepID=A0A0E9P810_ANGAN